MKTIITLLGLICFGISFGQDNHGEIKGKVFNEDDKDAAVGASVYVEVGETKIGTTVDLEGRYTIKPLRPGTYNLYISFAGKQTQTIEKVIVKPSKITWIDDTFLMDDGELITHTVETYREPLILPEDPTAQTLSAKMIENSPNLRNTAQLIGGISSDIQVSDAGDVYVRGSRNDAVIYYLDGVKLRGIPSVPGQAINSITVYTGGIPAKYGDVTGGVVIMETKSYFDLYNEAKANQ